ncbi:hypothetical protein DF185_01350 [Marinifilum breve]|uniref:Uncharacterized protein n=1 Tax=Marinifilum breve TaxID=2184082 RepID=A0A2V4A245_9BACT|nr:hypothetical protein [Marinifilum breve]PXY02766.1 hypothetical protein DF185_01350 [Marinifilum breve]
MKNILLIILSIFVTQFGEEKSYSKCLINRNDKTVYIEMYALNRNEKENYQTGVYACKLEYNNKVAFCITGDTLTINTNVETEKVKFKHDLLKVFIYYSKDAENMFFYSSPSDTLFLKQYERKDFLKINDLINIE